MILTLQEKTSLNIHSAFVHELKICRKKELYKNIFHLCMKEKSLTSTTNKLKDVMNRAL